MRRGVDPYQCRSPVNNPVSRLRERSFSLSWTPPQTGGAPNGCRRFFARGAILPDYLGDQFHGANLIQIERVNHEELGVAPEVFDTFHATVVASFKEISGTDWTTEMEAVWSHVVDDLTGRRALHGG